MTEKKMLINRRASPGAESLVHAALCYVVDCGWPIFPVSPRDKSPLIKGGFHNASADPHQVADWWERWPRASIGFSPGSVGLIVLDVDGLEGIAVAERYGADIDTLECVTSRGVHKYFRLPAGVEIGNGKLHTELDVRAHNGYVILPPSIHPSGKVYRWRSGKFDPNEIAVVPSRVLVRLLMGRSDRQEGRAPTRPLVSTRDDFTRRRVLAYMNKAGIECGLSDGRKRTAYKLACFLLYDIPMEPQLAAEVLVLWNNQNDPPLDEDNLRLTFEHASEYAQHSLVRGGT